MYLSFAALPLILGLALTANGQLASTPYYGLPLGSIFYSSSSTQGEVYVSDSRKVTIVNFQHGGEPGCTTFMVGPPVQGFNVSLSPNKDGVILAIEQRVPKRRRRQAPVKSGEKADQAAIKDGATIIQLGNPSASQEKTPPPVIPQSRPLPPVRPSDGKGIVWEDQAKPLQPQVNNPSPVAQSSNNGGGIRWADSAQAAAAPRAPNQPAAQPDVIRLGAGDGSKRPQAKLRELPIEYIGGLNIPDDEEGKNNPNVTALLNDPFNPDRPDIPIRRGPTEPTPITSISQTIQFGGKRATPTAPTTTTQESVKTYRGLPIAAAPAGPAAPGAAPPGIADATVVKLGGQGTTPSNGNGTIAQVEGGNHTECGNGWCVIPDPRRRIPGVASNATAPLAPEPTAAPAATPASNGSNLFVVVDDRRSQFLPSQLEQPAPAQLIATNVPLQEPNKGPVNLPVLSQPVQEPASRFAPPSLPQDGKVYILPRFSGENVVVRLPEPYELSEFQWFGIYDHCKRARTAFVNVRGIQAPKEVKLDGLRGWQYDVSSGDIFVKNCNTLQITNFTFSGAGKTEAYVYVGNGAFPHSIIQKGRAYIDGTFPDRSLKNFNNEDVVVKLPDGWKTFDITWIAVFNPKGNVSYGHVLVPPLVVPACEDPK